MEHQITMDGLNDPRIQRVQRTRRQALWFTEHWMHLFAVLFGIYWFTPFLAPVFMHLGWTTPANIVYTVYSTQCHQMAQRSFFLFGSHPMYTLAQLPVQLTNNDAANMLTLRAFIGNDSLGWKVAWSDRMISMWGGVLLAAIVFLVLRQRRSFRPMRWYVCALLALPMALDGGTHFLSDLTGGVTGGFRYTNNWLAKLTNYLLPNSFYIGDAFGSFNSFARLITGLLFGFGLAWFALYFVEQNFRDVADRLRFKLKTSQPSESSVFE